MKTIVHSIICHTLAQNVYQVICDTAKWPELFEACVKAEVLEQGENYELVRITAQEHEREMVWDTYRTLLDEVNGVDFYLPTPMPLLKSMQGRWRAIQLDRNSSLLLVERSFEVKDEVSGLIDGVTTPEEAVDFMMQFIERNSHKEMLAIKNLVEVDNSEDEFSFAFESSRIIPFQAEDIYHLLADVANWSNLIPHCQTIDLLYDDGSNQEFIMEVGTPYGNERVRSIRRCHQDILSIEYFQPEPPPVMTRHCGSWMLNSVPDGTQVLTRHEFSLDSDACLQVFGDGNLEFYKQKLHQALETNSLNTLEYCEHYLAEKK